MSSQLLTAALKSSELVLRSPRDARHTIVIQMQLNISAGGSDGSACNATKYLFSSSDVVVSRQIATQEGDENEKAKII